MAGAASSVSGLVWRVGRSAQHRLRRVVGAARFSLQRAALRARLSRKRAVPGGSWHPLFKFPLVDLGDVEAEEFRGVVSPAPEVGTVREGIDAQFLGDAEAYYAKYQGFDYWRGLIREMTNRIGLEDPSEIVEFGCGFGNSTLPLLDLFPKAKVVATDLSPNLLAILNRLLAARGLQDRCIAVAMDAQKDFIRPACADLVIGSAILHHLVDPAAFARRAFEILRPGGAAVFFEPLEGGYSVLRLICQEIGREAGRRGERGPALAMARRVAASLEPQIFRQAMPGWSRVNDKWAFPRSVLDALAKSVGAELTVYPLHDNVGQFRRIFAYMLATYGESKIADLPPWAWDIFDRYDTMAFSPEMLTDLALEGCIVFRKSAHAQAGVETQAPRLRRGAA
jgi:SAM-dependent methyltransferase